MGLPRLLAVNSFAIAFKSRASVISLCICIHSRLSHSTLNKFLLCAKLKMFYHWIAGITKSIMTRATILE